MRDMPEREVNGSLSTFTLLAAALCAACSAASSYQNGPAPEDCFAVASQGHMPGLLASNHVPGAVVSYIKNGEVAWTKAFGVANLQTGTPMRPDMVFNHGCAEPFAAFMDREVAEPLGLSSLAWVWTPQLERRAPTPYDAGGQPVGYRQLASQAIGSEICTVPDFARFVAATVSGPGGEPPGRGVLKRETISTLLETFKVEKVLGHSGANPGWYAHFRLDVERREGFVIANNSSRGGSVNESIAKLWPNACPGKDAEGMSR